MSVRRSFDSTRPDIHATYTDVNRGNDIDFAAEPERFRPRLLPRLRRTAALALALTVGAVGASFLDHSSDKNDNQALSALASLYGVQPSAITGEGLRTITPLKGPGHSTTKNQRQRLRQATMAIMLGESGNRFWENDGSGTAVSYRRRGYILTALHLFDTGSYPIALTNRSADVLTTDNSSYAAADPALSEAERSQGYIFGKITNASFIQPANEQSPDIALLKVSPISLKRPFRSLHDIHPLHLTDHLLPPPKIGDQVYMYGAAASIYNSRPVGNFGTYLGRVATPTIDPSFEEVDIVGEQNVTSSNDACEHGHSGESFIAGNNYTSGPFFYRAPSPTEPVPFGEKNNATASISERWHIQQALHANLRNYNVLCAFSVMRSNYPAELLKGFGVQADPYK